MALKRITLQLSDGITYNITYFQDSDGNIDLKYALSLGLYAVDIKKWPLKKEAIEMIKRGF